MDSFEILKKVRIEKKREIKTANGKSIIKAILKTRKMIRKGDIIHAVTNCRNWNLGNVGSWSEYSCQGEWNCKKMHSKSWIEWM